MQDNKNNSLLQSLVFPLFFLMLIWGVFYLDNKNQLDLNQWGTLPRTVRGLSGIILTPLLHGDFGHILTNTFPILILGTLLFYFYKDIAFRVFILLYLFSGIFTWSVGNIIGSNRGVHIGASGILYGLASFLVFSGIIRKNKSLFGLSLLVIFLYGTIVWGVLPTAVQKAIYYNNTENISWEGHLGGFITGIVLAYFYKKRGTQKPQYSWEKNNDEDIDDSNPYWMEGAEETSTGHAENNNKESADVIKNINEPPLHFKIHYLPKDDKTKNDKVD